MADADRSESLVHSGKRLFGQLRTSKHGFHLSATLALVVGLAIGIFIGQSWASHDMTQARTAIQDLQTNNSKLQAKIAEQAGELSALQANIKKLQDQLHSLEPSANTYDLDANHALSVADGRLLVALVGSPANNGININVNGSQHFAAAGDIIKDPANPTCQVQVQSFDMFQAEITASCR
jgi:cell division protein FtsB